MVLLLEEADDPESKLLPPRVTPVTRMSVDEIVSVDGDSDEDSTVPLMHDPPPSYNDVEGFRKRAEAEHRATTQRVRYRFRLALAAALVLCSLSALIAVMLTRNAAITDDGPPDPSTSQPSNPAPTSDHPRRPPWDRGPDSSGREVPWPPPSGEWDGGPRFPRPGDGRHEPPPWDDDEGELECSDWVPAFAPDARDEPTTYMSNYTLPYTAPLSIRSFLERATGSIRVSRDNRLSPRDAFVQVAISGISQENLEYAEVCFLHGTKFNSGLRFKSKGPPSETASYSIHLFISSKKQEYPGLQLYLPRFTHFFDDLSLAQFEFVTVDGEDASISATSLAADSMHLRTTNGSIDGAFMASRRLYIRGESQPITITASICNHSTRYPTNTYLVSSQAPIEAKLVLCEEKSHASPRLGSRQFGDPPGERENEYGRYDVFVSNSDSPISLQVEHASPEQDSSLWLNVTNFDRIYPGRSHTMVTLDTGFEGTFSVQSQGKSSVPVSVQSEDATDDRGVRHVEIEQVTNEGRSASGKVYWGSPAPPYDQRRGSVWVSAIGKGNVSLLLRGD